MKPITLAFEVQPPALVHRLRGASGSRTGRLGVAVLALAIAGLVATAGLAFQNRAELAQARVTLDEVSRNSAATRSRPASQRAGSRPGEAAAWAALVTRLNMPWSALLTSLEATTPDDVALVAIEPEAQGGTVNVVAEAPALAPLLAYAAALRHAPLVQTVTLARHETVGRGPGQAVRLQLQLHLGNGTANPR